MSRSERATVLRINSVGAVGAQVAPGRVVFEHRAEDHEQRAHAGGERANTRVGQAASTDGRGYRARDAGGAQSASIPKSARSTISTTSAIPILPPFPSFRHSCAPSVIPAPPPSFLRPLRHSCAPSVIPAEAGIHATAQPCDEPPSAIPILPPFPSFRHSHPSAIPAPPPSFLRRQESTRPPNRATSLHPPFPSFRHSCAPSVIPAPPPSFLRPLRHSCAPSVIPAEAGIHATAQPCDEPPSAIPILPPSLRPLRHSCAPSVIPAPPPSFLRRQESTRPPNRATSLHPPFPSFRHSCAPSVIPAPPPSFLRRQESTRPPNRATSLHPPFPSFRHSCAPSVIPAPPPSFLRRQESTRPPNRATSLHPPFPSFRHSCAPSVIPAEAGIHATAQPCDEPPSAIPIPPPFLRRQESTRPPNRATSLHPPFPLHPSFLRPLRHSCGGRNPRDRPTVRRASIRPTAHQSPQRAAGDRAPSNIGSALDPTDRMDSCLRRNDGQAGVTEGRRSDGGRPPRRRGDHVRSARSDPP